MPEEHDNIFDTAARQLTKNKKKLPKQQSSVNASPPKLDPEVQQMMDRMQHIKNEVSAKLQALYHKHGVSEEQVFAYMENPKNFTPYEWETMQTSKKFLMDEGILSSVKKNPKPERKKSVEKLAKEFKGKMLGSRKHWMPVK